MKAVVLDPLPVEVERLIERRQQLGLDGHDEVWGGVYRMAPCARGRHGYLEHELAAVLRPYAQAAGLVGTGAFNLGDGADDFRVPDGGYHRDLDPETVYFSTAVVVVEILSSGHESYGKLPFYAAHGVEEVVMVHPDEHRVEVLILTGDHYQEGRGSAVPGGEASRVEAAVRCL
ncbi:MAG: Uma2 family endonuclease [Acidimicrobiales bacterium]